MVPSALSIILQIPDVEQLENETVVQYFSKALKINREFKTKINPMELHIPDFMLPPEQVNAFVPQTTKTALNTHMKTM